MKGYFLRYNLRESNEQCVCILRLSRLLADRFA